MTYQEWLAANPAHAANAVPGSALSMQAYQEAMSPPPAPEANMSPVMRPGPPVSQPLSTAPAPEAPPGAPPPPPAPEGPGVLGQAVLGARGAAAGLLRSPAGNLLAPAGLARRAADAIAPPETAKPGPAPEEGADVTPTPPEPPPMPSWFTPEEKKGGGGGMVAMGPIGARNITQQAGHFNPEVPKLLARAEELGELASSRTTRAIAREAELNEDAQKLVADNHALQVGAERRLEAQRLQARADFEQRLEDKRARAREEAPGRGIGALFSAVAVGLGGWAAATLKGPNMALDLYKHASEEEARRQERESKDENNYYSRMLQEFGDRKQALAMTKVGYLEQGRAAFAKAAATAKTEHAKAALAREDAVLAKQQAALMQEMTTRADGERTEQTTRQIYPGQVDAQGNGPPGIRIEGPGRPVAPAAGAAQPAAPKEPEKRDDSAWGRLSGLWKERQAEAEKAAAVGAGIRGAVGGLGDRIGSFISGDPEAARTAPAPAVQVAPPSVKSIARPGAQLTGHVPGSTLAPDGRPPMTFKEHEAAVKKIDTLNEKHKDLIEARAAAQAFESAWSAVDPAAWKLFDPKKAAAYREAYKAASLVESKGNALSRAAAGYVGLKSKAEIDAELAREPDAFRKMFIAHNTMHQARLLLLSGKAVTNSEMGTDNLTMFSSDIPVLMMQAYKTGIRGPLDTKWNGATSTWGEPEHRMWRYSQRPTFMKALGDTQAMERGVKETKVGAP